MPKRKEKKVDPVSQLAQCIAFLDDTRAYKRKDVDRIDAAFSELKKTRFKEHYDMWVRARPAAEKIADMPLKIPGVERMIRSLAWIKIANRVGLIVLIGFVAIQIVPAWRRVLGPHPFGGHAFLYSMIAVFVVVVAMNYATVVDYRIRKKVIKYETDTQDDRGWGKKIAQEIAAYQQQYPGRPIYLIGQSGGCAVAVFAAESLATAGSPPITGIVLLDASLSADYDLGAALGQCGKGIVNFYNLRDVAMLEVGTEIFGNLDGSRGDSAGRMGFTGDTPRLFQVQVTKAMVSGFESPHFADTSAAFTAKYIAPWIMDQRWPVPVAGAK